MRTCKGLLIALLLLTLVFPAAAESGENLLVNGDFESLNGQGLPAGWYTDAYVKQDGYTLWDVSEDARGGERSAIITNFGDNDARYAQRVEVEPESYYCLSGYVKVLEMTDYGRGANLSIDGLYVFSDSLYEATEDWVYLELYGLTGPNQHDVTVFVRVGGYSGESIGSAQFDDVSLRKVEALPGNATADKWYRETAQQSSSSEEEEEAEPSPFWPWLIVISAAYIALGLWMMAAVFQRDPHSLHRESNRAPVFLVAALLIAAVVRCAVGTQVSGYQVDVNCFRSWGGTMKSVGPAMFYQTTSFCDYTPGYLYVLGLNATVIEPIVTSLARGLDAGMAETFAHKVVPILCDLAMAYLLYRFARRKGNLDRRQAGVLGALFALNPAMTLNSAGWCQIDSALCLCLMLVAWLAIERKWSAVLPVYVLSALVKPQALMLGPLGLVAIVLAMVRSDREKEKSAFSKDLISLLIGLGISAVVAVVVVIPFCFHQESGTWLIDLYMKTLGSYPYATVNTANLYYLLDANWVGIDVGCSWQAIGCFLALSLAWGGYLMYRQRKLRLGWLEPACMGLFACAFAVMLVIRLVNPGAGIITWTVLGTTAMVMAFVIVLGCYIRAGKLENLPLCGAVLFILLYVLGIKMHERYLFPALILLGMAFAIQRDIRVFWLMIVMSCSMLLNEGIVLDNSLRLGSSMGHLNNDTLTLNDLTSLLNVAAALFSLFVCHSACVEETSARVKLRHYEKLEWPSRVGDSALRLKRLDYVLMLSVTLIYAVVALTTLGSTKAPQTSWKSTGANETVYIDLGQHYDDVNMLYFCQVSYSDFSVAMSEDGETWSEEYWAQMAQGQCFRWKYLAPVLDGYDGSSERQYGDVKNVASAQKLSGRYVRLTAHQIGLTVNELIFRDAAGNTIPATVLRAENVNETSPNFSDPAALLDEQQSLEGEPSWWNGTYFDEIYHARTAYEHLHGMAPYETSHPPLGKVIMSWGVAIFGMTPFGWRFAGALAGILMLPVIYLLGMQLTKRTSIAFAAMAMMTLDCMHFTQTRIATIDSFPVLFIMLSWLFMIRFAQRDIVKEDIRAILPDLALGGLFMGCGIASKWIGVYSGAGLAIAYFWICARHIRLYGKDALKRVIILCLWCLLFFVTIPVVIYLLSYIPYFAYAYKETFMDYVRLVIGAQEGMFNYHSKPGLGMDHPFYSPWYEWPLIKRPMYYASPSFVPEGWSYALFCFGNPAVWLTGLAGVAVTAFVWGKRHFYTVGKNPTGAHLISSSWDTSPALVLIGLLAQFLPWVLVPRGTYIYHYFASIPFLILAVCLMLHWILARYPATGRVLMIAYLVVCLVFFIAYFPYASGFLTPTWWLDFMKQFLRIYY